MNELKIFKDMEANCANCPFDITEGNIKRCYDDCGDKPNECYECSYLEYYLKSEADKVIAEKDKELRHSNHTRCLAMARWCASRAVVWDIDGNEKKSEWYWKWKERWKKLAKKFKEEK